MWPRDSALKGGRKEAGLTNRQTGSFIRKPACRGGGGHEETGGKKGPGSKGNERNQKKKD